jgi:hypothetical protein
MPRFRTKKHGANKGDVYPLEAGSDIKSGPIPYGKPALKQNRNEVKIPAERSKTKPKREAEASRPPAPSASSSAAMCTEAEKVLKETDDA